VSTRHHPAARPDLYRRRPGVGGAVWLSLRRRRSTLSGTPPSSGASVSPGQCDVRRAPRRYVQSTTHCGTSIRGHSGAHDPQRVRAAATGSRPASTPTSSAAGLHRATAMRSVPPPAQAQQCSTRLSRSLTITRWRTPGTRPEAAARARSAAVECVSDGAVGADSMLAKAELVTLATATRSIYEATSFRWSPSLGVFPCRS
jgi:hypothetical protein